MKKDLTETPGFYMFECGVPEGQGVPLLSTSKLLEAFRNQKDRNRIKSHLFKLKAEGYVKDRFVCARTPFDYLIQCHEWQLTNKGKRFLREGGLPLPVFRHDGSLPTSKTGVESSGDKTAGIMPSKGEPNSKINLLRANQAATILHAFSLVHKTLRSR